MPDRLRCQAVAADFPGALLVLVEDVGRVVREALVPYQAVVTARPLTGRGDRSPAVLTVDVLEVGPGDEATVAVPVVNDFYKDAATLRVKLDLLDN